MYPLSPIPSVLVPEQRVWFAGYHFYHFFHFLHFDSLSFEIFFKKANGHITVGTKVKNTQSFFA
jgi:hypothetical protein